MFIISGCYKDILTNGEFSLAYNMPTGILFHRKENPISHILLYITAQLINETNNLITIKNIT